MADIDISRDGAVLVITINRPQKKNALTFAMYSALDAALRTTDPEVRAILLTGTGDTFTAGNDLKDFLGVATSGNVRFEDLPQARFLEALASTEKPLVAAVNGPAIGVGATMLLHCDLVYASESARLEMPFVSLGLVPEAASSLLLPERVGHVVAAELLLLGSSIDAVRAKELRIVNEVVRSGDLVGVARAKAHALAAKPPEALRAARALLRGHGRAAVIQRLRLEGQSFGEHLSSSEARTALSAFVRPDRSPA
jgi:enoyl-CoA hydratase/carnithine racemase